MEQAEKKKLPKREEIDSQYKWKLEDMYESDAAWEADFRRVKELLPKLEQYRGHLAESAESLLNSLNIKQEISLLMERLFVYARMRRDENNANTAYQALTDRASSLSVQVGSATSFMVPEILSIPEDKLMSFVRETEGLKQYEFYFKELFRQKQHVLSAEQEEILAQAGELAGAQSAGQVGTTFTPGFLLTAIMALATAWIPTNPFGPSYDPNALKTPNETREAIAKAVSLLTKGDESISN